MRKIALCTALLAILSAGNASAKNDFDALLGELSFGGSSSTATQALTLDNIAADNLAPAPNAQVAAQVPVSNPVPVTDPVPVPDPVPATDSLPTPEPLTMPEPEVAEQSVVAQPTVAISEAPSCDSDQACCSQQCGNGRCRGARRCGGRQCSLFDKKERCHCVPHTPPNLPTSSFYEYFKSNSCHCRVWDGYQNRCIGSSKHSRGECDCFEPRKKMNCFSGLGCNLGRGVCRAGSGQCQTDGCHELPASWNQSGCAGEATCAASSCDGCDG